RVGQFFDNFVRAVFRPGIRVLIHHVRGRWYIRIYGELQPLNKAVIVITAHGAIQVTRQLRRLDSTQYGNTDIRRVDGSSSNAVRCVATVAIPSLEEKRSITLMSLPVPGSEQSNQFVAK